MKVYAVCLLCTVLFACAHQPMPAPAEPVPAPSVGIPESDTDNFWWYARFRMAWPEQESIPDFASDLIIANEVVAPLLKAHADDIRLWRFHRRAARDSAGRQFSFIFYARANTAGDVFQTIEQDPLLDTLLDMGVVLEVRLDDPARPRKPDIAGTSDPSWAPSVQKSWPYFIMGVSVMFLDLLEQEIDATRLDRMTSTAERLDYYQTVNAQLTQLWKKQGRHAYFHHISGIFGYEPIDMRF